MDPLYVVVTGPDLEPMKYEGCVDEDILQHSPRVEITLGLRRVLVRRIWVSGARILVKMSATLFREETKTKRTTLETTCSRSPDIKLMVCNTSVHNIQFSCDSSIKKK